MDTETEGGGQKEGGGVKTQTLDQSSDRNSKLPPIDTHRSSNFGDNRNGSFAKASNHNSANNSDSGIEAEAPDAINPSRSQRIQDDSPNQDGDNLPKVATQKDPGFNSNNVLPIIANSGPGYDQFSRNNNPDPNFRDLRNSGSTTHSNPLHANNGYIYQEKLNFRRMAKSRVRSLDNLAYCTPQPSNYKIFNEKIDFRSLARSKLDTYSSLDYKNKRPQVVIFREKIDFSSNAKARIGSLENLSFQPRSNPNLRIFNEPLHVEAKPKIKSFENINFSPRKIEPNIVQHSRDWFTPAKTNSTRNEDSYFPSINNTNPIQLEAAFKRKITPRYSENDEMKNHTDPNVENAMGVSSKTPRNSISKAFSYQSEPVFNNKKVHFINNDQLSIAHRKKFANNVSEENQIPTQFQAIDEENGQQSAQVTPRNLETRQNKSRLRGRRHSKVFPDEAESKETIKESRQFVNASRLGSRDALPEIGEQRGQRSGYGSPEENKRVLQEPVEEEIYDAVVEKSGVPSEFIPEEDQVKISSKIDPGTNEENLKPEEFKKETQRENEEEPIKEPESRSDGSLQKSISDRNSRSNSTALQWNADEAEIDADENNEDPRNVLGSSRNGPSEKLSSEKVEDVSETVTSMSKNSFDKSSSNSGKNVEEMHEKPASEIFPGADKIEPEKSVVVDTRGKSKEQSSSEVPLGNDVTRNEAHSGVRRNSAEIENEINDQNERAPKDIVVERDSVEGSPENLDKSFNVGEKTTSSDNFSENDKVTGAEPDANDDCGNEISPRTKNEPSKGTEEE